MAQPGGARAEMTAPDKWTKPNANQRRALRTYQRVWGLHLRLQRLRDAYWAASNTKDPAASMKAIVGKDPLIDDRIYSWLKRYDPREGSCGCSMESAKPMGRPLKGGEWDESKHPRGQPDNAGQFVEKGGGAKKKQRHPVVAADKRRRVQGSRAAVKQLRATTLDRIGDVFAASMIGADIAARTSTRARAALLEQGTGFDGKPYPPTEELADFRQFLDGETKGWDVRKTSITAVHLAERARVVAEANPSLAPDMQPLIDAKKAAQEDANAASLLPAKDAYEGAPTFWRGTTLDEALALAETGEWGSPAKGFKRHATRGKFVCLSADSETAEGFSDGALIEADGDALRALANTDFDAGSPASRRPDMRLSHTSSYAKASWPEIRTHLASHFESRIADGTPVQELPVRAIHVKEGTLITAANDPNAGDGVTAKTILARLRRLGPVVVHEGGTFGFPVMDSTDKEAGGAA